MTARYKQVQTKNIMDVTIGLTQLKRKKLDDGTIPIYIRCTENRRSRYRSTGISVLKSEWNIRKKAVNSKHRNQEKLNIILDRKEREVKEIREDLYRKGKLTLDNLMDELTEDVDRRSVIDQATEYKKHLKNDDRYWEQRHFSVVINNLKAFLDETGKSDRLESLNSDWVEAFQDYLLNKVGNSNNTVRKKLQRLKGMTDWLIKNNDLRNDPFLKVEKVASKRTNSKTKLSFDQIKAIDNLSLEPGSRLWHVRNYFVYSFYNAGIRFGDLCCLKWKHLIDGRLVYKMNKTGQTKSIHQLEPMYRLLFRYVENLGRHVTLSEWEPENGYNVKRPAGIVDNLMKPVVFDYCRKHQEDFIFPLLERDYKDPLELRKRISSKNVQVNERLKTIAKKAGIQANISFHVSRHSFAHYALKGGMDLYAISKALGHSDLKVTQEYIKSFDEELLDKSMGQLF